MQKLIFNFIFLFIFINFSNAQSTFFRHYYSPENDPIYSVCETNDNNFIVCGTIDNEIAGNTLGRLFEINDQGIKILDYSQESVFSENTLFSSLIKYDYTNQNFIVIGSQDSISGNETFNSINIWVFNDSLVLSDGNDFHFGNLIKNTAISAILNPDSIIYILSLVHRPEYPGGDLSILKTNISGDSLAYFIPPIPGFHWPQDLIFLPALNRLKIVYTGVPIQGKGSIKILELDSELGFISTNEPDFLFHSNTSLCSFTDSSYLLASTINEFEVKDHLFIGEFNLVDESLKFVEIQNNPDTIINTASAKNTLIIDSTIWVVGIYNLEAGQWPWQASPSWIQLNRLNSSLELIDQHFYGGDAFYMSYDIKGTSDGGVMIVGTRYEANAVPHLYQTDPFVLKVNSEGLIVNVNNPEKPIAQEAIVLPNPGSEYLQVKLAIQHKTAHFQLFDINGRLVLEENLQGDMQRVSTSSLNSGTYIYRITASNRVIGSGKWVKD